MGMGARALIDRLKARQPNVKSLGQHYLHDEEVISSSIEMAELSPDDRVIEIGPGPGVLTERLLETSNVIAIEIDEGACDHLRMVFPELELIEGDALQVKWPQANKVVANIPYQISSPLIDIITRQPSITHVVVLLQEEFAERLVIETLADRGSLGMCVALDWDCEMGPRVAPHCFIPAPQVHSRLVCMKRIDSKENSRLTKLLIRQGFEQRRKKLRNTLSRAPRRINRISGWHAAMYKEAFQSIDSELLELRPEDLKLADWLALSKELQNYASAMG